MNWAQENKTLAGIVGVMVAGGLGLGVWLYLSWSGYSDAMETWEQTQSKITQIKGKKLAPTTANVERRQKELSEYADKVNQLRGALLSVQQAPKPILETEFQAKLKERATAMKTLAKTLGMKDLPDDFALGFDKYATQPPRSPQVAAELNVHLDAIEKLVTTCIEAGVVQLVSLERTKLPDEEAPAPPKPAPTTKAKAKAPAKKGKQVKTVITEQAAAEPVLDRYPIKLRLLTDQVPFQTIVNTLCHPGKMPHFLVVRLIRVENERLDGPTKEEMNAKKAQAANQVSAAPPPAPTPTEAPKADAPQLIVPPKPAPPDVFDIIGKEMLNVYLEVDYVRFRPAAALEEEEAPAPAAPSAPAASAAK